MHKFDKDMAVSLIKPSLFNASVSADWSINLVPNGGYILAIIANAMLNVSGKNNTPILTASYASKCVPGSAELTVETFSESGQFTRVQTILRQNGTEKVRAFGTFASAKETCFIERIESPEPEIAPLDQCIPVPALPKYTLMDRVDLRLDPACTGWMQGNPGGKSEQKGWISFKDDRQHDIQSVALLADSFPPAILASQGLLAWVPTIEFSVNIRNIPKTKWIKGIFRTKYITCGLVEEDGELRDENGGLVAISRQIAQFRQ
ncbi:MAG: thioesterase family protein [Spirochaetes bacterium]|jgi:hypothetical protein|nr:thioesterase family protein [Spirochaetota bacterium]